MPFVMTTWFFLLVTSKHGDVKRNRRATAYFEDISRLNDITFLHHPPDPAKAGPKRRFSVACSSGASAIPKFDGARRPSWDKLSTINEVDADRLSV